MPLPRKKSCKQCRVAKTRCSLTLPHCIRCQSRGLSCDYSEAYPQSHYSNQRERSSPLANTGRTAAALQTAYGSGGESLHLTAGDSMQSGSLGYSGSTNESALDAHLFQDISGDLMAELDWNFENIPSEAPLSAAQLDNIFVQSSSNSSGAEASMLPSSWQSQSSSGSSNAQEVSNDENSTHVISAPNSTEQTQISWQPWEQQLEKYIPKPITWANFKRQGLVYPGIMTKRQISNFGPSLAVTFILNAINTYPDMLTTGAVLPPFVHHHTAMDPHHCDCCDDPKHRKLPEPLAICSSIVHMFRSKTDSNHDFVMRTLMAEQQRLYNEFHDWDDVLQLAALQAVAIYLILLSQEPVQHEAQCVMLIVCMGEMALYLYNIRLLCEAEKNGTIPTWEEWAQVESVRRTVILLFMIDSIHNIEIGFFNGVFCAGLSASPLPCGKELWEAPTRAEWESKYKKYLENRAGSMPLTYGALRNKNNQPNDALDSGLVSDMKNWSAGLDGFGTMVMMLALAI